jgi:hypothetical protein
MGAEDAPCGVRAECGRADPEFSTREQRHRSFAFSPSLQPPRRKNGRCLAVGAVQRGYLFEAEGGTAESDDAAPAQVVRLSKPINASAEDSEVEPVARRPFPSSTERVRIPHHLSWIVKYSVSVGPNARSARRQQASSSFRSRATGERFKKSVEVRQKERHAYFPNYSKHIPESVRLAKSLSPYVGTYES